MVDYAEVGLVAASAFFAALSFGLLYRYRQVSREINNSSDLGRDLWASLETRLRKQDERLLDVMARLDVVQAKVLLGQPATAPPVQANPDSSPSKAEHLAESQPASREEELRHVAPPPESRIETKPESSRTPSVGPLESIDEERASTPVLAESGPPAELDETQTKAIAALNKGALDTRQLTQALGKSREHTARVMKELFEKGLVTRKTADRPFTYALTDQGKRYLN